MRYMFNDVDTIFCHLKDVISESLHFILQGVLLPIVSRKIL